MSLPSRGQYLHRRNCDTFERLDLAVGQGPHAGGVDLVPAADQGQRGKYDQEEERQGRQNAQDPGQRSAGENAGDPEDGQAGDERHDDAGMASTI